ncbi:DNA topoisomerase (ATP-hydrolyzing) subunit A [Geitlerinema sp. PCC 9228]|jgi:DNA gyrase subunit A|uniref:DNA topoisomerase (ATP-hydrolyzing) subunit A n=1 Tax=Geitlerinema sp. PCC 9228 TaxID=111611 RepID=UPI0008F9A2A8|nr:DNA topoisomerase (ATP-hydrolyzing) subunit A [Geitlerinema sp. PCC 9228]
MANQLNLLSTGQVISTPLHTEMQQAYLEYAMSVIVGRALPDIRDGLKPVHRRILYAMHELGLTPDRPYRKCARVVGDVLGKYHPHGDQAVYDAMVRMIQDFSCRYPLLDGHGNFGSIDNDPPAAMRYTETRLAAVAHESLLSEIDKATVDFIDNFDNSQQEPVVLPAQLPMLLLNGCSGIAVGMATNVPPHNLTEVVDGLIALIDKPQLSDEKLFEIIPGPDFPTGGEIVGSEGIRDAYTKGRGTIPVRGVVHSETVAGRRMRRTALVVTELPFQVNKANWIEKVANLVNHGQIEGIADIRDESDREGIRVVIELKRETDPQAVLRQLYKQTPLQVNFGAIFLALVGNQPRQLSLRETLQEFLKFREEALTRRYTHELEQTQQRLHLVSGLRQAIANLDRTIDILRQAADGSTAKATLQSELEFSEEQAQAILAMPLRRLTALEQHNLQKEFDELTQKQEQLQKLLSDRQELLKALKKELRALKRKYGNPRRTQIVDAAAADASETVPGGSGKTSPEPTDSEEGEESTIELTYKGYIRRFASDSGEESSGSRRQKSKKTASKSAVRPRSPQGDRDLPLQTYQTTTDRELLAITADGKAYSVRVRDIPKSHGRHQRSTPLIQLLPPAAQKEPQAIASSLLLPDTTTESYLLILTYQGRIKRLPLLEAASSSSRGITVCKLKSGDRLISVQTCQLGEQVLLATSGGRILRFEVDDTQLPIRGRTAQGDMALRLRKKEKLVGMATVPPHGDIALISAAGYAKRLPVNLLRLAQRGSIGTQAFHFPHKNDTLAGMVAAHRQETLVITTDRDRHLSVAMDSLAVDNPDSSGDRLQQLQESERVVSVLLAHHG